MSVNKSHHHGFSASLPPPIQHFVAKHRGMIGVQLSAFFGLFFWFPFLPKKIENQLLARKVTSLRDIPAESTRKIFRNWKGIGAEMAFQPLFPFIFQVKQFFLSHMKPEGNPTFAQEIFASSLGGAISGPVANALNVVIIHTRQHPNESSFGAIHNIWKQSGVMTFLRGSSFMSLRNFGFGGVFFGLNPQTSKKLDEKIDLPQPYKGIAVSVASATSSAVAGCLLTMPIDTCSVWRQAAQMDKHHVHSNLATIREIYSKHGWKGFFVGTHLRIRASLIEFTAFNIFFNLYNESLKRIM